MPNPFLGSLNNCLTKLERRIMVDAKSILRELK